MHWGSFDPFLVEDSFWQDKMGKPVVSKEFLQALLTYGTFECYDFFCPDRHYLQRFKATLEEIVPAPNQGRVRTSLQARFREDIRKDPLQVMHQGDFTYHMPFLMELRNSLSAIPPFPITGVTHSLDRVWMHTRFLQLLLARPQPFDAIVCTSGCARQLLTAAFDHIRRGFAETYGAQLPHPPQLVHIPLAIGEEFFTLTDKAKCRKSLEIPQEHLVMLSLARFSPRLKMDLAPLLECVQWLVNRKSLPPFTLVLAGAGKPPDLALVREMVSQMGMEEQVRIESNVSGRRKLLLYGAADVFLSLVDNYQETFGLTILEAMAQGLPVVASDFNGYKELVVHERTGYLIPTYASAGPEPWESLQGLLEASALRFYLAQKVAFDVTALGQALLALAANPHLRQEMGTWGRAQALSYKWSWIIPCYEDLWKNLHQMAKELGTSAQRPTCRPSFLAPPLRKHFGHFPTQWLAPTQSVGLSEYGRARSQENFQPILYEDLAALLSKDCLAFLINRLQKKSWVIADLAREGKSGVALSGEMIMLHMDWLLKHGYLAVTPEAATTA